MNNNGVVLGSLICPPLEGYWLEGYWLLIRTILGIITGSSHHQILGLS